MTDYKEYLLSDNWKNKRKQKLIEQNYECSICGSKHDLQVHHKTYHNLGYENLSDLIVLCKICHKLVKGRFKKQQIIPTIHDTKEQDDIIELLKDVENYNIGLTSSNPTCLFSLERYTQFEAFGRASESEDQYWKVTINDKKSQKFPLLSDALKFIKENK